MAYFDLFPDVLIASQTQTRNSNSDIVRSKNLFRRGAIRGDFFKNAVAFNKYQILGDDRPDNVAEEIYGNPELDWVVLLSNNIINIHDEWPMSQADFQRYLDNKYDKVQLGEIHHYETKEVRNPDGILLLQKGHHVDADFSYKFSYNGVETTVSEVTSVTNYQHEINKNDEKRSIYVLREQYLTMIMDDMRDIMTYTNSSQYINKRTKKGSDIRME
tara:strand:- start:1130 stop:1777 length:648 start_codon:yes stop_codon:yes gene_type:complete